MPLINHDLHDIARYLPVEHTGTQSLSFGDIFHTRRHDSVTFANEVKAP